MVGFYFHSLSQIETVGTASGDGRYQSQLATLLAFCKIDDPVEQLAAVARRTLAVFCYKVFDLQIFPAGKPFSDPNSGDRLHAAVRQKGEMKSVSLMLPFHAVQKIFLDQVRARAEQRLVPGDTSPR